MTTLTITLDLSNAAFIDDMRHELTRILNKVANDVSYGNEPAALRDTNGNTVGNYTLEG